MFNATFNNISVSAKDIFIKLYTTYIIHKFVNISMANLSVSITNLSTTIINLWTLITNLSTSIINLSVSITNLSVSITNLSISVKNLSTSTGCGNWDFRFVLYKNYNCTFNRWWGANSPSVSLIHPYHYDLLFIYQMPGTI